MFKLGRQNATEAAGSGARRGAKSNDPTADVKRRARQRLIGAAILVLTAIIVVPMLLDSEPRPLGQDIAITIPSKDTPFSPRLEAGQAGGAANDAAGKGDATGNGDSIGKGDVPVGAGAPASASAGSPAALLAEPAAPPVADGTAPASPVAPTKPAAAPLPAPAAASAPKPETAKPDAAKPAESAHKADDGTKALALLEGKDAAASKPAAAGKLYVQVGAFATEEKVRELQARLKTAGVATFTEKVKTGAGERIRLRAGPYGERADAERVLGKIKAAGINGAAIVQ